MKTTQLIGPVVFLGALAASRAAAMPQVFFNRDLNNSDTQRLSSFPNAQSAMDQFVAGLTNVAVESFELSTTNSINPAVHFGGAMEAQVTGGIVREVSPGGTNGDGRYPISGLKYLAADQGNMQIAFASPLKAFGFWGIDVGDFGGTLTVNLLGGGSRQYSITPTSNGGQTTGSVLFWGVIDPAVAFTGVNFQNNTGIGDVFAFDDLVIGELAVPLPSPAGLVFSGLGLGAFAAVSRRRR